jgi:hypothetical protein
MAQASVVVERVIEAPIARVWPLLADFGGLRRYAPVSACTVEGQGIGMLRTVTGFGKSGTERLDMLDDQQHLLRYSAVGKSPLPLRTCETTVQAFAEAGHTRVRWASDIDAAVPVMIVRPILEAIYSGALNGLQTYLARENKQA